MAGDIAGGPLHQQPAVDAYECDAYAALGDHCRPGGASAPAELPLLCAYWRSRPLPLLAALLTFLALAAACWQLALTQETSGGFPQGPCGVNVILARHCDKRPPWDVNPTPMSLCTQQGLLRGEHMARIFGPDGAYPLPTRLFARKLGKDVYGSRDMYLLWPLAQRLGLVVNATFAATDVLSLAQTLLEERLSMCGQTILVSWDHCSIPALGQALGCSVASAACGTCWDDDDYDTMWWLRYDLAGPGSDWNFSFKKVQENFALPSRLGGYRECIGNPVENRVFGYGCQLKEAGPAAPVSR
eukprot:TRINITY_DN39104_c0_g1_i1.p2 TRINITY_DN39104_c0_g1~~TRINITY_DN39104_c0_g1_i1.p2  ORF type:complete len:300 (-),score=62.09 TRINITY_DN39104_c0_g1_i1:215-1114(-)